jgi:hypothetical protein
MPTSTSPRADRPDDAAGRQALKVASAVEKAWHQEHGTGRVEIPISVVATLADIPFVDGSEGDAIRVLSLTPDELIEFSRRTWHTVILAVRRSRTCSSHSSDGCSTMSTPTPLGRSMR